ncbi:hypothetical protein OEZ86_010362 [Tetradesmus obliquus]|nr:hypothetical protein OEZ86_010362 [Tetradesmus obliquus]
MTTSPASAPSAAAASAPAAAAAAAAAAATAAVAAAGAAATAAAAAAAAVAAAAGCTGALPSKPPGALAWGSSCQGQAACSTPCDIAAGYSAGTVSITCDVATKTWSSPSGSCTKSSPEPDCNSLSQTYCAGCGVQDWKRLSCVAAGGVDCKAVLNDGTPARPQRCAALLPSSSSRADGCPEYWYKDGKRFNYRQTYIILPTDGGSECNAAGCTGALPSKPPGALAWGSSCQGQAACSTPCDIAAGYSAGTVSITCDVATKTWSSPSGTCTMSSPEPDCNSLSQTYCAGCGVQDWKRLSCVAAGGVDCKAVLNDGTPARPQRCAALLPSSSSRADGCPEYWYKDGKRFNYRQTYIILPTDGGSECNAAGCTGALPSKPPGALAWGSSCQGQAACSTPCDIAAGYSAGTVSITCDVATKTWSSPSGSCTMSSPGCTGELPSFPAGALQWSKACLGRASCTTACLITDGYIGGPITVQCNTTSNVWGTPSGTCYKKDEACSPGSGGSPCKQCPARYFSPGGTSAPCIQCACPSRACTLATCNRITGGCSFARNGATCTVETTSGYCKTGYCFASGLTCTGLPAGRPANSLGWPQSCKNKGHLSTCVASCKSGFEGVPQAPVVECKKGKWTRDAVGQCKPKAQGLPYTECRQMKPSVSSITMRQQACKDAPPLGVSIPACARFQYLAAAPPKVSDCASRGTDFSCWIEVIYNDVRGWIPSGSGTSCQGGSNPGDMAYVAYCPANGCPAAGVGDSTCRQVVANTVTAKQNSLLVDACAKDMYTECRQVARPEGVPVLLEPFGSAVSPPLTLKQCDRFEHVVMHKQDVQGVCWIRIRYYSYDFLQFGWVQASESACGQQGTAYIHDCPSSLPACAQQKYCRQVFTTDNPIFKDIPCWDESNRITDVPKWGVVSYHGSLSKQSSRCKSQVRDPFCWALVDYAMPDTNPPEVVTGWMPVGRVVNAPSTFADAFCNGRPGDTAEAFVRELCDFCAGKPPCPDPPVCQVRGLCNSATGACLPATYAALGSPCGAGKQCDGQGGCVSGLNVPISGTLIEEQDKELPSGDIAWLQQLDTAYQASASDAITQADLLHEAEAVRFKSCGWYNEGTFRQQWCQELLDSDVSVAVLLLPSCGSQKTTCESAQCHYLSSNCRPVLLPKIDLSATVPRTPPWIPDISSGRALAAWQGADYSAAHPDETWPQQVVEAIVVYEGLVLPLSILAIQFCKANRLGN